MTGNEFAAMSDAEVDKQIDEIGVIARVAPKTRSASSTSSSGSGTSWP